MNKQLAFPRMNKYVQMFGAVLFAGALVACSDTQPSDAKSSSNNDLLPTEVVVKYEHELLVAPDADKIKGIDYVAFVTELAEKIKAKKIDVFDPLDKTKKLDDNNLSNIFDDRVNRTSMIDEKTFDTVVTEVPYKFDPSSVQKLVFREEWNFSKEKFAMTKTIREYAPIRLVKRNLDGNGFEVAKQMLLWINADKKSDSRKLLAENVTYEFNLYNQDNPEWLESLSVSRFVDLILSQVLDGKSKAYDFFADDKVALSVDVVRANLGATVETYYVENEEKNAPDTVQVLGNIYPDEIRSVIFVEDWYVDDNMVIYKTVKRIAPVRHYHMVNELAEDEIVKKVPFVVDLNY